MPFGSGGSEGSCDIWETDLGFRNVDGAFWLMHTRGRSPGRGRDQVSREGTWGRCGLGRDRFPCLTLGRVPSARLRGMNRAIQCRELTHRAPARPRIASGDPEIGLVGRSSSGSVNSVVRVTQRALFEAAMSNLGLDYFLFTVEYDAPFGTETLRAAFVAIRDAVADNWGVHRDRLSDPRPLRPVDVDRWLRDLRVGPSSERCPDLTGGSTYYEAFPFSFSPVSYWPAEVMPVRTGDGRLKICVTVPDRVLREDGGTASFAPQ